METSLLIIYLAAAGEGISGGTRIHTELTKQWLKNRYFKNITIIASDDGYRACIRNGIDKKNLFLVSTYFTKKTNFWIDYAARIIKGIWFSFCYKFKKNENYFVYTASDFWADFFPALIFKLRYRNRVKLLASLYLFAPLPWAKNNPYKERYFVKGLFYWLTQIPVYFLIKYQADYVFVTSQPDVNKFITKKRDSSKIIVVQGGVDIRPSEKYLKSGAIIPVAKRQYDACFVGRFHHQKGVLELVDIWRLVCQKKRAAKLVMLGMGMGSMGGAVKSSIKKYHLENNIDLFGFLDGEKKYQIFKNSKIIVHPATYDSGGMAAAEAMAWGLPGVAFDLQSLKTYYPKGMLKSKINNNKQFAENILKLLDNKALYKKTSADAHNLIVEVWDWEKRAKKIFKQLES